jgi:hypothetical protein
VSSIVGWMLAGLALVVGWIGWRWQGVVLAVTVIAFWLTLQFSRAMRVMRRASSTPVGYVDSAVMLNARLRRGMALWEVITLARSLGRPVERDADRFVWSDPGGAEVRIVMRRGRLREWELVRPPDQA